MQEGVRTGVAPVFGDSVGGIGWLADTAKTRPAHCAKRTHRRVYTTRHEVERSRKQFFRTITLVFFWGSHIQWAGNVLRPEP